jgi:hypothetical protein
VGKQVACHRELHPAMNVYGLIRKQCPVCGGYYYEDASVTNDLNKLGEVNRG